MQASVLRACEVSKGLRFIGSCRTRARVESRQVRHPIVAVTRGASFTSGCLGLTYVAARGCPIVGYVNACAFPGLPVGVWPVW